VLNSGSPHHEVVRVEPLLGRSEAEFFGTATPLAALGCKKRRAEHVDYMPAFDPKRSWPWRAHCSATVIHCCRQELISWSGRCVDEMVIGIVPHRQTAFPTGVATKPGDIHVQRQDGRVPASMTTNNSFTQGRNP
jgi:hypothetical protein